MITAQAALAELRRLHRRARAIPVTELPGNLYDAILQHFGSIRTAREAIGVVAPSRARKWSRERVLAELRRLHHRGMQLTTTNLRRERGLLGAIKNHVGTIREARALAGIPEPEWRSSAPTNTWDDLEVVRVIEQRVRTGQSVASSQVPSSLYTAARKHWGSWARAIEAAGLDYATIRRVRAAWTQPEIIAELRRLHARYPQMTRSELVWHSVGDVSVREFGTLDRALEAAGLRSWPRRLKRRIDATSRSALRKALCELERQGVPLTARNIARRDPRLLRTIHRTVPGPWREVLAVLGFEDPLPRWDRGRVEAELRRVHAMGQSLNARHNARLAERARYYFGSLAKAAKAIGATIRPHRRRSRRDVIAELRTMGQGIPFVASRHAGSALASAARKHFGSWQHACKAAGVKPGPAGGSLPGHRRGSPRKAGLRRRDPAA
jgi:hypothetical protein